MTGQLTIQIVGWNSVKTLPEAVAGLRELPDAVAIRYIDNASEDGSVALIREQLPKAEVVELSENTGFTNAHNVGMARCETKYILTHDPDLRIEWNGIERLLEVMEERSEVAAMQGKLLRSPARELIDSTGIVMTLSRNGRERGGGAPDNGQWERGTPVDAVTGACGLYRMADVRAVAHGQYEVAGEKALEVYDKDFFAYKDDVDLGWRLRSAGKQIWYEPVLAGYHQRSVGSEGVLGWGVHPKKIWQRLRARRTRYSFRNYIWMLVKNMSWRDELRYDLFIGARVLVFLGFCGIYWPLATVWGEIVAGIPRMLAKRADTAGNSG